MRVLITGISGFAGLHLLRLLRQERPSWEIFGSYFTSKVENWVKDSAHLIKCDLKEKRSVESMVEFSMPDRIFHLAGESSVFSSWREPVQAVETNINGQIFLFEAMLKVGLRHAVILCIGSSEEYGIVDISRLPLKEDNCFMPVSPYAVTKVAQDLLGYQYFKNYGLNIIRTRSFNHTGPGRSDQYALSGFAKQIAEIEAGGRSHELLVGNLDVNRDYLDVRDVVKAYLLLLEHGRPGETYNVCRGESYRLSSLFDFLLEISSLKGISITQDTKRMRPSDILNIYGDPSKIREETGWRPEIDIRQTLRDLLEYWRSNISG